MFDWFANLHPVVQALYAGVFTWMVTMLGAGLVFLKKNPARNILDALLGFAAGVMIAASFWSLLAPSIDMAASQGVLPWLPPAVGFLLGAVFLRLADRFLPHLHPGFPPDQTEGIETTWKRTTLLVLAITLHNIPEGLAVGVAFGAAAIDPGQSLFAAIALAIGIGIQNFPEGVAVSMPLRRAGVSRFKSFWYGQMSAIVEPVAAVAGAAAVLVIQPILPYALAFAAGAMIFVVVEEVLPEAQLGGRTDLVTTSVIIGFTVMMVLDVALG